MLFCCAKTMPFRSVTFISLILILINFRNLFEYKKEVLFYLFSTLGSKIHIYLKNNIFMAQVLLKVM